MRARSGTRSGEPGGRGTVDAERTACPGRARDLPGRQPGPAADVQDMVVRLHATGPAQYFVVPPQFGVVAAGTGTLAYTKGYWNWLGRHS